MNLQSCTTQFKQAFKGKKAVRVLVDAHAVEVHHYAACICKVLPTGEITIDNGGYESKTTKNHLNTCLQILGKREYIYQKKFEWLFSDGQPFQRHFNMTTH